MLYILGIPGYAPGAPPAEATQSINTLFLT